jgi:hypothetical protein
VPSVQLVFPPKGKPNSLVFIIGSGFNGATKVDFGKTQAQFAVLADSVIIAIAPPQPKGVHTVDVTVTSAGGTSTTSMGDQFRYIGFGHGHGHGGWSLFG